MAKCGDYIKSQFPLIDDELKQYVEGMLEVIKINHRFFPDVNLYEGLIHYYVYLLVLVFE